MLNTFDNNESIAQSKVKGITEKGLYSKLPENIKKDSKKYVRTGRKKRFINYKMLYYLII